MATTSDSDKIRESKGKLIDVGPEITPIADLEPTVTRQLKLSCIESGPQSTSTLANRQTTVGNPIQANMDIKDADYFHRLLHLKKAYRITGFSCEQTGPRERTLENPTSLIFRRYIDLIEIPNDGFPEPYFNFASYNELPARADVIIAILTAVNRVHTSGDATRNRVRRRTIDIQDLNGNTIVLTPWHEMALNFNVQEYEPMEKPVVIAVSSCWVMRFNGIQLLGTSATHWYLNPNIPETYHIKQQYLQLADTRPIHNTYILRV